MEANGSKLTPLYFIFHAQFQEFHEYNSNLKIPLDFNFKNSKRGNIDLDLRIDIFPDRGQPK